MIRSIALTSNGIGIPFISQLSDDHKRIIVKVFVAESSLPKNHEELRQALVFSAYEAIGAIASEFGLSFDHKSAERAVKVEFISLIARVKDPKSVYADFTDGELTFH